MATIDRERLAALHRAEEQRFGDARPRSRELASRASSSLLGGVPMNWMARWPGRFPVFVERAEGALVVDVDGHEYVDFCLGDTGAMTGHAPPATVATIAAQARAGLSMMLPTDDAIAVGEELARRFGLPSWQLATSATDANRFALRVARQVTGRSRVVVCNWCYHGTVDETLVTLTGDGRRVAREGHLGPPVDPALTTDVVEFNDLDAMESVLAGREVAAVILEPVMTNIGIIHPDPGYHEALRRMTRASGRSPAGSRPGPTG
jgi:glutamate-1-semialdehyde aminotransferase